MRTSSRLATLAASVIVAGTLAACAQQPMYSQYPTQPQPQPAPGYNTYPSAANNQYGTEFGTVANIEVPQARSGGTSGAGVLLGAVVGGVLGNQVGGGMGRAAATAVGAIGGGFAGNAIEGRTNNNQVAGNGNYRLIINLDNGGQRVFDVPSPGDLRPGDRVRINGGQISRM